MWYRHMLHRLLEHTVVVCAVLLDVLVYYTPYRISVFYFYMGLTSSPAVTIPCALVIYSLMVAGCRNTYLRARVIIEQANIIDLIEAFVWWNALVPLLALFLGIKVLLILLTVSGFADCAIAVVLISHCARDRAVHHKTRRTHHG